MEKLRVLHGLSLLDLQLLVVLGGPLLSFAICSFISEKYAWAVSLIAGFLMIVAAGFSIGALVSHWDSPFYIAIEWFSLTDHHFSASLLFTNRTLLMLMIVSLISLLV